MSATYPLASSARLAKGRLLRLLIVAMVAATAVGCGATDASGRPPDLTVDGGGAPLVLRPWSYCWGNACVDGAQREPVPEVGTGDRVTVSGGDVGLRFTADFTAAGRPCARVQRVPLGEMAARFVVWPAGPAGTYDVTLHADGGSGRTASYTFRWTTTRSGVWPTPTSAAAVLANDDGRVDTYGVNVTIENLARTPRSASATLTVTSAGGLPTTIPLRWVRPSGGCEAEGSVRFEGAEADGRRAARSGSMPFRYDLVMMLDGGTYRGIATWPDDQIADFHPYVSLRFRPALPGLRR